MNIDTASFTCSGGREINEDSLLCRNNLYIVADGHGGHNAGEKASAAAIEFIENNLGNDYSEEAFMNLLEKANDKIRSLETNALTTAAFAVVNNGYFHYANVGDSRVYIFRNNHLFAHTKDHSICQALVDMGEFEYEDIRCNDDRSKLLKVLGNPGQLNLNKMYQPVKLADGDAFIVCSDGFWGNIYETEMEIDLHKSLSAEQWMNHMLKRLMVKTEGEGDNYSVICGIVHTDTNILKGPVKKVRPGFIAALIIVLAALAIYLGASLYSCRNCESDVTSETEVTLSEITISETDLSETDISETDISETEVSETAVPETDVSETTESDTAEGESQTVTSTETSVEILPEEMTTATQHRPWLDPDYVQIGTGDCIRW